MMNASQVVSGVTGKTLTPTEVSVLNDLLKVDETRLAARLAATFPVNIPAPTRARPGLDSLGQRIKELAIAGKKAYQIADQLEIQEHVVYTTCREHKLPLNKSRKRIEKDDISQIRMLRESGKTPAEIACLTSISPASVGDILRNEHPLCRKVS